ncbi:hypothetical protein PENSPDRAFT_739923 [Peniophora sp. CONT]|nr:hypothetical protein PENSPDRAFT_739923 [Peniophora sp. CONT]
MDVDVCGRTCADAAVVLPVVDNARRVVYSLCEFSAGRCSSSLATHAILVPARSRRNRAGALPKAAVTSTASILPIRELLPHSRPAKCKARHRGVGGAPHVPTWSYTFSDSRNGAHCAPPWTHIGQISMGDGGKSTLFRPAADATGDLSASSYTSTCRRERKLCFEGRKSSKVECAEHDRRRVFVLSCARPAILSPVPARREVPLISNIPRCYARSASACPTSLEARVGAPNVKGDTTPPDAQRMPAATL